MVYNDMPIIIPLLATGYLFTIYLLLMLAQWTMKSSRYAAKSLSDSHISKDTLAKNEVERWSLRVRDTVFLSRDGVSKELMPVEQRTDTPNMVTVSSSTADS